MLMNKTSFVCDGRHSVFFNICEGANLNTLYPVMVGCCRNPGGNSFTDQQLRNRRIAGGI